jgi:superfamily II DNA/RNA helicase
LPSNVHVSERPRPNRRRTHSDHPAVVRSLAVVPDETPSPSSASPASFAEFGLPATVIAALSASGATSPFPIQAATLPDALAGRDVLGRAQTGSGKTIAFALPVVIALAREGRRVRPGHPGALILVPTRELAAQVTATIRPLASALDLHCATIHGGVSQAPQTAALRRGAAIVIATPGRLEDLIAQGQCHLDAIQITVLDEADHMADLGFLPAVNRLLDQTPRDGQRLLFSATLDNAVTALVQRYLHQPAVHSVDSVDHTPTLLQHHLFNVRADDKAAVVAELASGVERSLLFTRTKRGAKQLASRLTAAGIPAVDLHGNLTQPARSRNLAAFTDGDVRVLVATDIAARGIHVDDIALVVHVDPPTEHKAYLHRSGRTARAGAAGAVVTVVTPDQARDVNALMRKAAIRPRAVDVSPGDGRTVALTGPPAQRRAVAPVRPPTPITNHPRSSARPTPGTNARSGARPNPGTNARSSARPTPGTDPRSNGRPNPRTNPRAKGRRPSPRG